MTKAIKTCPFCGSAGELKYDRGNEVWGQSFGYGCSSCWAKTPMIHGSSTWRVEKAIDNKAKADALAAWNKRT